MAIACIPCAATAAPTLVTSLGGVLTTGAATLAGAVGIKKISKRNKTKKKDKKKDKKKNKDKKKKKNQSGGRKMRRRTNKKSFKSRQRGGKSNKSLRRSFSRVYIDHI